jgi:hypothetical protein
VDWPPELRETFHPQARAAASRGCWSHSDTALYISLVVLYIRYTGLVENDFNVYTATPRPSPRSAAQVAIRGGAALIHMPPA